MNVQILYPHLYQRALQSVEERGPKFPSVPLDHRNRSHLIWKFEEISCTMNVEHCVTISTDTSLDNTAGSSSSNIADKATNLALDSVSGICDANPVLIASHTELDIAPNTDRNLQSPPTSPPPSLNDSLPNFSIGVCPLIVNDSLVITIMLNELIEIVCNDLTAGACGDQASIAGEHNTMPASPAVYASSTSTRSSPSVHETVVIEENMLNTIDESVAASNIENYIEKIVCTVFNEIFVM
ncbi:hypothetical protein AVEN_243511-1 [Araneus ventricosus]|uniref:Uncharacterized protein n=1 Tax=Araneus ventricosus TaxID=182803 RepID=A0A4Y2Q6E0_ARAVE|nr:hypothetical protein AVEN_243511-1 [Araneus ventricosus]